MYLNAFAPGMEPLDLTATEEFASLLQSARELGIATRRPARYESRNIVLNGLRLHFLEWGDPAAPPLLLLHGGNQTAHSWDLVSLALSTQYHTVALDQRGHGDSEWPRDGDLGVAAMVEDVVSLVAALGLSGPTIIGHSLGGVVAMTLLLALPRIATKAVLVDVAPEVASEGAKRVIDFVRATREFESQEQYVDHIAAYDVLRPREHISRTVKYNLLQRPDGKFVSKHFPRHLFETAFPVIPSLEAVAGIRCPVLVVRGEQSSVLLPDAARRFADALPAGRLLTVPNCGHNVHSQNTTGFLDGVAPFLAASGVRVPRDPGWITS